MRTLNPPLGPLSVDQFMRGHWQRKPLLIRAALPDFKPPLSPEALFELATRDDVESRLVSQPRGRWRLDRGPFDVQDLPARTRRAWTLLVQGVDLHVDAVHDVIGGRLCPPVSVPCTVLLADTPVRPCLCRAWCYWRTPLSARPAGDFYETIAPKEKYPFKRI